MEGLCYLVYKTHLGGYEARIGEQNHGTPKKSAQFTRPAHGKVVIQTLLDGKKLRTSFFVWSQYKENRNKARRILTKIAFSALNVPFLHWHRVAMQIKHDTVLKAVAKAAQQEMEVYRKKRAAAFMRQLRQSGLARIFRGWHFNVVERVHQRNVVNRFVKRWKNQGLAKIFLLFVKNRQIRQRHRHVMTRFFTHLSLKKEKMGFKKWQILLNS